MDEGHAQAAGVGADGAFDVALGGLPPEARYRLLSGLVVPRPIALVTTLGPDGVVNAAPYSFFNAFSEDPPLVILGIQARPDGGRKDTAANAGLAGEFVVNLVSEAIAGPMNVCATDFPPHMGELGPAGLTPVPSARVAPPAIAEAPVALECRRFMSVSVTATRELLFGEVLSIRAAPGIVDPATLKVDLGVYRPVGRLSGNLYARLSDTFTLVREPYDPDRHGR